ncbi:MAG: hypothetical protein GWN41_01120 [Phycisphaerae bacterium]|nr:hypothetical protein [Phycisphaerae bacterium]
MTKSRRLINAAFREVKKNPPKRVRATRRKKGKKAATRQEAAIALSKAKARGAIIKRRK